MPGCQHIPQRRHVELVANSETGSTGLKKGPSLHALSRSLLYACHEVCPVRDCSAPVVPRQEEFSGVATVSSPFLLPSTPLHFRNRPPHCGQGSGERLSSLSGSGQIPAAKRVLTHFRHTFEPVRTPENERFAIVYNSTQVTCNNSVVLCLGLPVSTGIAPRQRSYGTVVYYYIPPLLLGYQYQH